MFDLGLGMDPESSGYENILLRGLYLGLTPAQIRALEAKFAEEDAERTSDDPAAVARRERKRAERYADAMDWWFGSVTERQQRIITEVTADMPDTAADWERYRTAKRAELIRLLDRRAGSAEVRRFMDDWLVLYKDLPPALGRARGEIHEQITRLFLRMDESLSQRQREHFADRLSSIRDDFLSLQDRPRMATAGCAARG